MTNTEQNTATRAAIVEAGHRADAVRNLAQAFFYHRTFGHPIDGFTDEHNARRAELNAVRVAMFAHKAGAASCYAGLPAEHWDTRPVTNSPMAIASIRAAFIDGWNRTNDALRSDGALQ